MILEREVDRGRECGINIACTLRMHNRRQLISTLILILCKPDGH